MDNIETQTEENTTLTEETLFERLLALQNEVYEIECDIKELMDQGKEGGVEDVTLINAIAKAKARNKIGDLEDKLKKKLEKIEELA